MKTSAVISPCGLYRYLLTRTWDDTLPPVCWLMLNPSTADASIDDPTIRRCLSFTRAWGYGGVRVVNLYALRATDPKELWKAKDPVGPDNDRHLLDDTAGEVVVCGWGANARADRVAHVLGLIRSSALCLDCLEFTKGGAPRHPLYLKGDSARRIYR